MKQYTFKGILQNEGWLENRAVTIDRDGIIVDIEQVNSNEIDAGYALPGFQNAHSHAFQYAMAGLAEKNDANATNGDFWSWREAMYRLALNISPDQLEDIATMLYAEMVRHGYTSVAEFHYVHHDKNGKQYDNLAEMGSRLVAAAETAGINITLVPIFYQKGGFGVAPNERQKRFISSSVDDYMKLLDASQAACKHYNGANIAIGIHSMRGVEPEHISEIAQFGPQNLPFHIHISEQLKEIEDAVDYLGKRPVEWLAENVALSGTFYVGWKQSSADRLNIGFDKNINNQDKIFYDMGSGWTNTSFEGSLMIRPVFVSGFDDILASVNSNTSAIDFEMYPNPANDLLNINVQDGFKGEFKIYDMQGKLMLIDNLKYIFI